MDMSNRPPLPDDKLPTIFVSIANYRDSETPHTLRDLYAKATHPERVFVGVFSQVVPEVDDDCLPADGFPSRQVRELRADARTSLGACWARHRILTELRAEEDYVLQIDSHSRFVRGWDERFLAMLATCPSERALLTTYPAYYSPPSEYGPVCTPILRGAEFNDSHVLLVLGHIAPELEFAPVPLRSAFLSANCLFGPRAAFDETPYDPFLYFHGEEISMAIRFWTHGWDLFAPNDCVMYSEYAIHRNRPRHWTDQQELWKTLNARSFARLKHLFGVEDSEDPEVIQDFSRYGLGTQRSLRDFEAMADICIATRYVGPRALRGHFSNHLSAPSSSEPLPTIFVSIANYRDPQAAATVMDLYARASHPQRISVGVLTQQVTGDGCDVSRQVPNRNIREICVHPEESRGTGWARHRILTELLADEDFVLQIDSHSRFAQGWDDFLLSTLAQCPSQKPVLSSYPCDFRPPLTVGPACVSVPTARSFVSPGVLVHRARAIHLNERPSQPLPGAFICAGSLFAPAAAFKEVRYDPQIAFYGEECAYAARLWTHGWDLFVPHGVFMYHDYAPTGRRVWQDLPQWAHIESASRERVAALLRPGAYGAASRAHDVSEFGLGRVRSLIEYQEYADVDFATSHIGIRAKDGHFPPPTAPQSRAAQDYWQKTYFSDEQESLETRSGDAARLSCTHPLRSGLASWLREAGIRQLVDAGCGDLRWMHSIASNGLDWYVGYDIVPELVLANQVRFRDQKSMLFALADIVQTRLPPSQALLCRRVLNYLPLSEVSQALQNFLASGCTYLLATTHPGASNDETPYGQFRPLDLCAPPFSLPPPTHTIADYVDFGASVQRSQLAIWQLSPKSS